MAKKDDTLMVYLKAKKEEFDSAFKSADKDLQKFLGRVESVSSASSAAFSIVGRGASIFFAPLTMATKAMEALAVATAGVGVAAVHAAASDEEMIERLAAVYNDAEKAAAMWARLEDEALGTPFSADDMAEGIMMLDRMGMAGEENLETLMVAAKVSGEKVESLAAQLGALENRSLRKFGIEITGGVDTGYMLSMADAAGHKIRRLAATTKEARQDMLELISMRFQGTSQATGFNQMLQALKNSVSKILGDIGAPMLKPLEEGLQRLSSWVNKGIRLGEFEDIGKRVAGWIEEGIKSADAIIATAKQVYQAGPSAIADVLHAVFVEAANMLQTAIVAAVEATWGFWEGIAKLFQSVIGEELYKLPGRGWAREADAYAAVSGKSDAELSSIFPSFSKSMYARSGQSATAESMARSSYIWDLVTGMNASDQASLAVGNRGQIMRDAVGSVSGGLTTARDLMAGQAAESKRRIQDTINIHIQEMKVETSDPADFVRQVRNRHAQLAMGAAAN